VDPHSWFDTDNVTTMARDIKNILSSRAPAHAQDFMTRFETYAQGLADIDRVYQQGLALCKTHTLVYSGHYTFGYMAKRYNLTYIAAASLPLN
jgi:ABC-type Zn uptake system ZnuABC Zn-binding protein ZnuA